MSPEQIDKRGRQASLTALQRTAYFVLPVLVIVGALIAYKSSTALTVIGKVSATGVFTPRVALFRESALRKPVSLRER